MIDKTFLQGYEGHKKDKELKSQGYERCQICGKMSFPVDTFEKFNKVYCVKCAFDCGKVNEKGFVLNKYDDDPFNY